MAEVWSHDADVTNAGPFNGCQVGWDEVRAQFQHEAELNLGGHVEVRNLLIREGGDLAYAFCTEHGENMTGRGRPVQVDQRATYIFRKEGGHWKMVHHHTDISTGLEELAAQAEHAVAAGGR